MSLSWSVFKFVTIVIVLAPPNFVSKLNEVVMGMHHNCTVTDNSKGTAISQFRGTTQIVTQQYKLNKIFRG